MTDHKKNKDVKPKGLKKYSSLILLATSFFGLVAVLSGVTYFTTQKLANATRELDLASQQTILVQQMSKNLLDINLYLDEIASNAAVMATPVPTTPISGTTAPIVSPLANATATTPSVGTASTSTPPTPSVAQSPTPVTTTTSQPAAHDLHNHSGVDATTGGAYALDLLPQTALYQLQELSGQAKTFTDTLYALKLGGTIKDTNGNDIVIQAVQDPDLQKTLEKIETIWTPYVGLVDNFMRDTQKGVIRKETSDYLVDYVRFYNLTLQSETLDYSTRQNDLIQFTANQLRLGQIGGIGIAFLLFVAIVFGSLRQLVRADEQLAVAQRQTDDIMNTVNEGLFLIDKDLVIADQYSGKLEEILHKKDIAGRTLYDILEGMISQKDMDTTKLFIDQLYNTWVVEELIQDLNPLKQVLLSYIDESGLAATKFLEFNFLRVLDEAGEQVDNVFVSVTDITVEVNLQAQMQKDKEQHNRQIEMISYLLSVDGNQLAYFIRETKARIERMNEALKHRNTGDLKEKAELLYRETHSLKGDASAVHLAALVDIATKQEDKLKQLLQHTNLKGNDFLPFTVGLDEMVSMVSFIDNLLQRLNIQGGGNNGGINQAFLAEQEKAEKAAQAKKAESVAIGQAFVKTTDTVTVEDFDFNEPVTPKSPVIQQGYWQGYYENYAKDIADRQNKKIALTVLGFDGTPVSDERMSIYKDIATQLLKNAIVHGIESDEIRAENGKEATGQISLALVEDGDTQKIVVSDDGAGINWEKIRQKALDLGQVSADEADNLTAKDLLRLMFSSGLSTADKQDEDAGRGVGMDIVKALATEHHAKIGVNTRPTQFTEISISFLKE